MSLAEELLADLEDDDDYEAEGADPEAPEDMAVDGSEDQTSSSSSRPLPAAAGYSLDSVAKLYRSERLRTVVDKMEEFSESRRRPEDLQGPVEADPEYLLIVEANNLAAEIDDEIGNPDDATVLTLNRIIMTFIISMTLQVLNLNLKV